MRTLGQIEPQLLVVAAFSRHVDALAWAEDQLQRAFGPLALRSDPWPFTQTRYYEPTMGTDLIKQFFVHERLVPMDQLADVKRHTILLEEALQRERAYAEARPLNLDPGFINLGKFCLASTKDQAHRIYLKDGIFAEVTLRFQDKHFRPNPWTYPDYVQSRVLAFLDEARDYFRRVRQGPRTAAAKVADQADPPAASAE